MERGRIIRLKANLCWIWLLKAAARICKHLITCACAKSKPNAFTNGSSLRQTEVAGVDVCGHQLEHYITLGYPSCSWMHINTDFWSSNVLCCLCCCNLATYSHCYSYSLSMNALKFLTMLPLLLGLGHLPKPFDTWILQFPILWQTGHLKSLHLISCWQQ